MQLQQNAPVELMAAAMGAGAPGADIQNIIAEGFQPTQAFLNAQNEIRNAHGMLAQFMGTYTELSGMPPLEQFMSQEDADTVTGLFEAAKTDLESLKELREQELITQSQLDSAQAMTDNLSAMSDQAQAAAEAFENLSLSQALGQTDGGMAGDIADLVEKYMKDNGGTDADITAMMQGMGLASGRETSSSLALQNMIIPLLASLSPDQAGIQSLNIQDFLQNATLDGMSQNRIAGLLPSMAKQGFDYYNYDPLSSVGQGGEGGKLGDLSGAASTTAEIAGNMGEAAEFSDALIQSLNAIPDAKTVKILLTADDPMGLLKLLGGGSIGVQVRENGGSVPGTRGGATTGGGGGSSGGNHRPGAGR